MTPITVIAVLSFLTFFIPPQSGEKISFAMAVMVAYSVFLILVGTEIPRSSAHTAIVSKSQTNGSSMLFQKPLDLDQQS